jgi:hypothetical protein
MPRVLFDIDFSNQSFNNSADETDWILSPANTLIIPETATYTQRDTNVYVLNCNKRYGNSGTIGNLCFVSRKSRVIKEYELEIEFVNRYQAKAITINSTVTFSERELVVDGTSYTIGDWFNSNDYHKYKLRREGTNLYCYIDNNLVYTYDDTAEKCLLQGKLNFVGLISSSYISSFVAQYVKATELTVAPYITASSDQITAGDSVQLTVNGSAVSYLWSNGETTASIIVEPTTTAIYTCDVTTADGQITLSKTIRVSANVVYGTRGAVDDDTLFLMNFADGKLNVLKGTLIAENAINDPYYAEHLEVDGVSVVGGVRINGSSGAHYSNNVYPPFFDNSFWNGTTKPIDLTFEWTIYTPTANDYGSFWQELALFRSILNTSHCIPQTGHAINYGDLALGGYAENSGRKSDGSAMNWIIKSGREDAKPIYYAGERLPWLARMIIGNGWSAQGWHHIANEISFYDWDNKLCVDFVLYVDGEQIKTWHQEYTNTSMFTFTGEWFTFMTQSSGLQWYMSEMCITKGRKYNGTFELPKNFYKNYITLANDVLPEKNPEPNFTELAIVNAQGTDAPVMAIKIDCESLSKPICFAQSYHDFVARDDQGELQEFQSSGIQINLPERTNQSGSALSFGVGSISGEVMELCNTVMSGAVPCYLTLLEYLPFDTSREYDGSTAVSPIYTLKLFVTSCQITTKGATITAGWHDTLNAKFPYKRYTAKQFKGLRYVC